MIKRFIRYEVIYQINLVVYQFNLYLIFLINSILNIYLSFFEIFYNLQFQWFKFIYNNYISNDIIENLINDNEYL